MSDTPPEGQDKKVYVINTDANASRTTTAPRPRVGGAKNAHDKRVERVSGLLNNVGAGIYAADRFDGLCILERVNEAANALADLADENKAVAKAIDNLTLVGGYAAVLGVIITMMLPIVARHGLLPNNIAMPAIAMTAPESAQQVLGQMMAAQAERMADNANPDSGLG